MPRRLHPLTAGPPSLPPARAAPASPPARPGVSIQARSRPLSRHGTATVLTRPGLTWTVSPRWAAVPPGALRRDSRSSSSSPWRENRRPLRPPPPPARDAEGGALRTAAAVSPAPGRVRDRKRPCSPSLHSARGLMGAGPRGPAKLGRAHAPWCPARGLDEECLGAGWRLSATREVSRRKFPEGREHQYVREKTQGCEHFGSMD